MKTFLPLLLILALGQSAISRAAEPPSIRVGALAQGTLSWELAAIHQRQLDQKNGITLENQVLASPEAGRIALQGNTVDVIVTDWIWVAQQRQQGQDYQFVPFSNLHGALVTSKNSAIHSIADLKGKRIGVAGGGLDKNWILLKAAARKSAGLDLDKEATVSFAAPPLIGESLKQGQVDVILTYWNQAAKLEAKGFVKIMDGAAIQHVLGIRSEIPTLGYVFRKAYIAQHPESVRRFLDTTQQAGDAICSSDPLWAALAETVQEPDHAARDQLRSLYCKGRVRQLSQEDLVSAKAIFQLVSEANGTASTLPLDVFSQGTP
jgi:NitT/TauT family transport system substrate-binding protein